MDQVSAISTSQSRSGDAHQELVLSMTYPRETLTQITVPSYWHVSHSCCLSVVSSSSRVLMTRHLSTIPRFSIITLCPISPTDKGSLSGSGNLAFILERLNRQISIHAMF
ncbi:hypothetical protein FRC03_002209 [Tulasnella sp. 419]|nr:hypothetical protein FRC03_002209 [Tulasnella sp. 419]